LTGVQGVQGAADHEPCVLQCDLVGDLMFSQKVKSVVENVKEYWKTLVVGCIIQDPFKAIRPEQNVPIQLLMYSRVV